MRLFFGKELRAPIVNAFKTIRDYLSHVFDIYPVTLSEYESLKNSGTFREGTLYVTTDQEYTGWEETLGISADLRAGYYEGRPLKTGVLGDKLVFKYSDPPTPPTPALDPTKIAIFPLDGTTFERTSDTPYYANDYIEFRDVSMSTLRELYGRSLEWVEVIFGDSCGATNTDIEILYNGWDVSPDTPEPKLCGQGANYIAKMTLNEGVTRLINASGRISFPSNGIGLKEITIPSSVESISYYAGTSYNFFNQYLAFPDLITIKKSQDSIPGAPWGATNATITWTG